MNFVTRHSSNKFGSALAAPEYRSAFCARYEVSPTSPVGEQKEVGIQKMKKTRNQH